MEHIVRHDKGNWKDKKYINSCRVGACPHGCTGPWDPLQTAQQCMRISLGAGMETAKVYRKKGIEDAKNYYMRGGGEHETLAGG